MSKPYQRAYLEITSACNLKCSFCPSPTLERAREWIELDFFDKIIVQIKDLVNEVYFHLLGEPLLHPQLIEMIQHCAQNNLSVSMTTNGTLLAHKGQALLAQTNLRQINISLQALESQVKNLPETLGHIFAFVQQAVANRPDLYINLRLWNGTAKEPFSAWTEDILARIWEHFEISKETPQHISARKSLNLFGRVYLQMDTQFAWPTQSQTKERRQGTCHGLLSHFGILSNGTVVPCCLDETAQLNLGNLHQQSLDSCLNSPRAQKMKAGFLNFELVEEVCQKCPFSVRFKKAPKSEL